MKAVTAVLALALAPLGAQAQSTAPRASNPDQVRVGALRPIESRETLTDGGVRTMSNGQVFALPATIAKDYRISPNDLIDVEVLDADNLRRTVRVNAAGAVSLPLIGHVQIAGLTSQEAEERIASRYGEKYLQSPQVSLFIKEFTTERMTIDGAVSRPGIFPLAGQMTLLRALAVAGGFGPIADRSQVIIYRVNEQKKREAFVYDVEKIRAGQSDDPMIKGDDLIVVQRDNTRAMLKDSLFRDVMDSINPFSMLVPH